MYRRGIVIGSETLSKVLDWSDRSTSVLFGDGAGGVLLEASDQKFVLAENLFTDGSRGASLESCYLGLSSPYSDDVSDRRYLTMDGRAVLILPFVMSRKVFKNYSRRLYGSRRD